ncbi:hypothetical protein GCM10010260_49270 [Streptomyces filipinensis]|uniref:Uncharacterized protein n=1 Tax=Streptomyces filipinensis TaxID=66887 RepID=A0A918MDE4_9ACTN|nr:hypothetical protein GCM10010260_49270 [Streptomyces filipinensis]
MELSEVHAGQAGNLRWTVTAGAVTDGFATFLTVYGPDNAVLSSTGSVAGEPSPESPLEVSWSRADGTPLFVIARTVPDVERVVAVTTGDEQIELSLSPVVAPFRARFGVAALPSGCSLTRTIALPQNTVVRERWASSRADLQGESRPHAPGSAQTCGWHPWPPS